MIANHSFIRIARRFVLPFALFVIIVLVRHLLPINLKLTTRTPQRTIQLHIQGRWKPIFASLGLPPFPHIVNFPQTVPLSPMSRFDLRRKRSIEAAAQKAKPPQLHFATDALQQPSISIERIAASFRAVALAEKAIAREQARARLQRQGETQIGQRRPPSWGTRTAEISLGKRR